MEKDTRSEREPEGKIMGERQTETFPSGGGLFVCLLYLFYINSMMLKVSTSVIIPSLKLNPTHSLEQNSASFP